MNSVILFLLLTITNLFINHVRCANILAIFPHHGKSHFMNVQPYLIELANRGHNLTVISHFPLEEDGIVVRNYYDLSLKGSLDRKTNGLDINMFTDPGLKFVPKTAMNLMGLYMMAIETSEAIFKVKELQNFINTTLNNKHNFDLAIIETFNMDVFLGLVYKMNIPFISMTTCNLFSWSSDRIGLSNNPSHIATNIDIFNPELSLVERLKNTLSLLTMKLAHTYVFHRYEQQVAYDKFGKDTPLLEDIAKNTSLILANIHFSLNKPRSLNSQLIEIGGIHIQSPKPLNKDLEKFLNESKNGVIYFCMGSLLRAETLSKEKVDAFLGAFAELPQNILWKFEGKLKNQPKNVKILPWTPQRDILAHPNVKLFITHGGLLGTTEAVYEGVPMLGIPMFGDQHMNMNAVQSMGSGITLNINDITKETLLKSIRTALQPEYSQRAKELQSNYRDRPMSAMETAIYWTEYVIRHKGAHHLKSAVVHIPWYQYLCLDVALVLITILLGILFILKMFFSFLLKCVCGTTSDNKHKRD